jgi:hypothetical protein
VHEEMKNDYQNIFAQALRLVQVQMPQASALKHLAFAHAVAELLTGETPGYNSIRQKTAVCELNGRGLNYLQLTQELLKPDGWIFGKISSEHKEVCAQTLENNDEAIFSDDPMDIVEAKKTCIYLI